MSYPAELEQLKNRFQVFTQKLKSRALELQEEASASAQMMYDEDDDHYKRSYVKFKAGIEGQFQSIIDKVNEVFDSQIMPHRDSDAYDLSQRSTWYSEMQKYTQDFVNGIRAMMNEIFDNVQKISPEFHLQKVIEEYEEIKDAFHCQQCGANITIDQIYFVSTYITCPYCQTQNTFVPGSRMKELQHLAREVAEERLKPLEQELGYWLKENQNKIEEIKAYSYYRAMVWVEKSNIVPVFKQEYAKVYYRELYESISVYSNTQVSIEPETYQAILEQFGFVEEMKPKVLNALQEQNQALMIKTLKDWEMLYELSAFTIPRLYQGKAYEDVHTRNFQRIQEQWSILADINKDLSAQGITMDEVAKKIKYKF